MGTFAVINSAEERLAIVTAAKERFAAIDGGKKSSGPKKGVTKGTPLENVLGFIAELTVSGNSSRYRQATPAAVKCPLISPECPPAPAVLSAEPNAKSILDAKGPEELARWVREQKKVCRIIYLPLSACAFSCPDLLLRWRCVCGDRFC